MPNNSLSSIAKFAPFLPPRTGTRFSSTAGKYDIHYGGIAIGDASQGLSYQTWTCFSDGINIWLEAPNTLPFIQLANVNASWVALAFDQNARPFIAYSTSAGNASYYWYDTTIPGYRTSSLTGIVPRVFAALDDIRPALSSSSDILLAYVRSGQLYMRVQRDRFGIEYNLGAAPATLVQIGMNKLFRFQFAFQNVQGNSVLPPSEWNPALGFNEPA